jgi:hypothetical protein
MLELDEAQDDFLRQHLVDLQLGAQLEEDEDEELEQHVELLPHDLHGRLPEFCANITTAAMARAKMANSNRIPQRDIIFFDRSEIFFSGDLSYFLSFPSYQTATT